MRKSVRTGFGEVVLGQGMLWVAVWPQMVECRVLMTHMIKNLA